MRNQRINREYPPLPTFIYEDKSVKKTALQLPHIKLLNDLNLSHLFLTKLINTTTANTKEIMLIPQQQIESKPAQTITNNITETKPDNAKRKQRDYIKLCAVNLK